MVENKRETARPRFKTLAEEIEWLETHDSWDEHDEEVEFEVKVPLDKVVPVRLTAEKWSALHNEARELGIGPTTLARMWLLEKLRSLEAERRAATTTSMVSDERVAYVARRPAAPKKRPVRRAAGKPKQQAPSRRWSS
jgi:hypothetical protein